MIAQLPFPVFAVMLLFVVAMAGLMIYAAFRGLQSAAVVRATPTTPIGQATPGYREFEGTIEAVPGSHVKAPLTEWPCVWYEARVERYVTHRSGSHDESRWETVDSWTSTAPFLVRDKSGLCIVDPTRADVTPTDKSRWSGQAKTPDDRNPPKFGPTESVQGTLEVTGTGSYRYLESRIYAGDPLLVLGEFAQLTNEDDDEDSEEGNDPDPDDRLLDDALKQTKNFIARGSGAKPFIISTTPQVEHVALSEKGGRASLGIALVPIAIGAWLLWARYR